MENRKRYYIEIGGNLYWIFWWAMFFTAIIVSC